MATVIVVGSGVAGLTAALRASGRHRVVLVTKAGIAEGSTRHAQGGIAGVLFPDDSVEAHVADTLDAGAGLGDPAAVRVLCEEGPARIREMIALGVPFDRERGELAKGLEAAHSYPRVVHAGGDATGRAIEEGLVDAVRRRATEGAGGAGSIEIVEHAFLRGLAVVDGRVAGVELLTADGRRHALSADAVVLATGGAGRLFAHTTNPVVATGDGVAAALRAGALVADLEFMQFHPTTLPEAGSFLVSEAVRGEGAAIRDADGRRFLSDVDPRAELAPRDVVARAIARRMAEQGGAPVLLDATALPGLRGRRALARRFPTIDAAIRATGRDWATEPIPVTPAAHYAMGGVLTDLGGRTTLPGLYAAGECARTGVHGANRLASNSLLEGAVFGARAAASVDADLREGSPVAPADEGAATAGSGSDAWTRAELQDLLWDAAGLLRTGEALRRAETVLAGWAPDRSTADDASAPSPFRAEEDANLLLVARVLVRQALARAESRGAHHRLDAPRTDPAQAAPLVTGIADLAALPTEAIAC